MVKMAQGERGYGTRLWDPVYPEYLSYLHSGHCFEFSG